MGDREVVTCEVCGQPDWPSAGCRCDRVANFIRRACFDPGQYAKRERDSDGDYDALYVWQAKAVRKALTAANLLAVPVDGDLRDALITALWDSRTSDQHPTEAKIIDVLLPVIAAHVAEQVRAAKAEAWAEGYGLGVMDESTSRDVYGGEIPPARHNPYREEAP